VELVWCVVGQVTERCWKGGNEADFSRQSAAQLKVTRRMESAWRQRFHRPFVMGELTTHMEFIVQTMSSCGEAVNKAGATVQESAEVRSS